MIEEIKGILRHGKQEVEGRRELDQTVDAIARGRAKESNVQAAYAAYRELVQSYPELTDDVRLTDAMKQVSAVATKGGQARRRSRWPPCMTERPSGLLAAMPLAVQPVKGELAEGRESCVFAVEQGTAYGLDAATGKVLWRRFVALDPKFPAVTALPHRRSRRGERRRALRSRTPGTAPRRKARRAISSGDWSSDSRSLPSRCGRASGCCC